VGTSQNQNMDIKYRLERFEFEWDENKAQTNLEKHGVTFEEATEVFLDPFHVVGDASAKGEEREFALGYSLAERLLFVVHVERVESIRMISARVAIRTERKIYEQS
jgi:uncharacterized protein